eukprot:3069472-Prymnesium_polylepis.1
MARTATIRRGVATAPSARCRPTCTWGCARAHSLPPDSAQILPSCATGRSPCPHRACCVVILRVAQRITLQGRGDVRPGGAGREGHGVGHPQNDPDLWARRCDRLGGPPPGEAAQQRRVATRAVEHVESPKDERHGGTRDLHVAAVSIHAGTHDPGARERARGPVQGLPRDAAPRIRDEQLLRARSVRLPRSPQPVAVARPIL